MSSNAVTSEKTAEIGKVSSMASNHKEVKSANSSDSVSSNGEDYEIVQMIQQPQNRNEASNPKPDASDLPTSPSLKIVGNGDQVELQKKLEECCEDDQMHQCVMKGDINVPNTAEGGESSVTNERSVVDQTEVEAANCTLFNNIKYLGAAVINDPKNEQLIHSLMKELNIIDDLCGDNEDDGGETSTTNEGIGQEVSVRVPNNAEGNVLVRCLNKDKDLENNDGVIVGDFPIYRIIFFARGNAGTTEEACFAFTVALPSTPSLRSSSTGVAVRSNQNKVTFKCHAFRCSQGEAVTKVFTSFAHAFKKPQSDEGKP